MTETYGGMAVFFILLGFVVAVLWIFMPFAVFGLKDLVKNLITKQARTNELLEALVKQSQSQLPPAVERKSWE